MIRLENLPTSKILSYLFVDAKGNILLEMDASPMPDGRWSSELYAWRDFSTFHSLSFFEIEGCHLVALGE